MTTEKLNTIARPYALAAFEYALEKHELVSWEEMLITAASIADNEMMEKLLKNPDVTQGELSDIFCDILGKNKNIDTEKKNFIYLLAEYERLSALPDIARLFITYRKDYEKIMTVQLTSASVLDAACEKKFTDALTRRLKRKVLLQCDIDETLLGGAIIRAGDTVIDGSIRGKLNRLLEFI